jgi:hypothetical protein
VRGCLQFTRGSNSEMSNLVFATEAGALPLGLPPIRMEPAEPSKEVKSARRRLERRVTVSNWDDGSSSIQRCGSFRWSATPLAAEWIRTLADAAQRAIERVRQLPIRASIIEQATDRHLFEVDG